MILTADQLKQIVPEVSQKSIDTFLPHMQIYMPKYDITTPQRVGGFISQVAHESDQFKAVREYASGNAYEGREDLGNKYPGDGPRFKGRGLIQVTGRNEYIAVSKALFGDLRLLDNPDLLTIPANAVWSACWYWKFEKPMNAICDHPEDWTHVWEHNNKTYTKIEWMTLLINGGQNGIAQRTAYYQAARKVLNF